MVPIPTIDDKQQYILWSLYGGIAKFSSETTVYALSVSKQEENIIIIYKDGINGQWWVQNGINKMPAYIISSIKWTKTRFILAK